jgi:hypothetical protein
MEHITIVDPEGQSIDRADLEPQPVAEAAPSESDEAPEASEESPA